MTRMLGTFCLGSLPKMYLEREDNRTRTKRPTRYRRADRHATDEAPTNVVTQTLGRCKKKASSDSP